MSICHSEKSSALTSSTPGGRCCFACVEDKDGKFGVRRLLSSGLEDEPYLLQFL